MSDKKNSEAPSTYVPATEAGKSLWAALLEHPDSSAAELAIAGGIGKSTAPKLLNQWLAEGRVTKTPGIARGGTRVADRWAIGAPVTEATTDSTADSASAAAAPEPPNDSPVDADTPDTLGIPDTDDAADGPETSVLPPTDTVRADVPTASTTDDTVAETGPGDTSPASPGDKKSRLSKGALHGLVEDHFQEHPGETFGPSAISTKLQRSSGAVANACTRLVEKGVLVLAQDHPKRYALAAHD